MEKEFDYEYLRPICIYRRKSDGKVLTYGRINNAIGWDIQDDSKPIGLPFSAEKLSEIVGCEISLILYVNHQYKWEYGKGYTALKDRTCEAFQNLWQDAVGQHYDKRKFIQKERGLYEVPYWELDKAKGSGTLKEDIWYGKPKVVELSFFNNQKGTGILSEGLMTMLIQQWKNVNQEVPCEETTKIIELGEQILELFKQRQIDRTLRDVIGTKES